MNQQLLDAVAGDSLTRAAWQRFRANRTAVAGLVMLGLIALFAIAGSWISPHDMETNDWERIQIPPTFEQSHWFGTDANGRDLFVRVSAGARISLAIGMLTTLVSVLIGVLYGAVAGFVGGKLDQFMMRIVDVLYALPLFFAIIVLVTIFGRNIFLVFIAIGAVEWLTIARIVRGQTLSVKQMEFVEAARSLGAPQSRIIARHVIPNIAGVMIVQFTLYFAAGILTEAGLSFLGLGVQPPTPSWGNMLHSAQRLTLLEQFPHLWLPPGLMIAITVLSINFIGDALRDALDPRLTL